MDLTMGVRPQNADEAPLPGAREGPAPILQWIGLLLPAATFFAHLQVGYVLIPWTCVVKQPAWVHIIGIMAVVVAGAGTLAAWRTWMRAGREVPGEGGGAFPRTRFLGAIGLGIGAIFTLILVAQWLAAFFIGVCQ
jgi:hypothetical protein